MLNSDLQGLPWAILVTLAAGYMGYFIANAGINEHHKPTEVTFATLAFGFIGAAVYQAVILWAGFNAYFAAFPCVVCTVSVGALWRKWGHKWLYRFLRNYNISWSDNTCSAWQQLLSEQYPVYEVIVYLKTGIQLRSQNIMQFEGKASSPCVFGRQGDMILYVTHYRLKDKKWTENKHVTDPTYGDMVTYIPADQIARVKIRRSPDEAAND